jgi:hypothetical protein
MTPCHYRNWQYKHLKTLMLYRVNYMKGHTWKRHNNPCMFLESIIGSSQIVHSWTYLVLICLCCMYIDPCCASVTRTWQYKHLKTLMLYRVNYMKGHTWKRHNNQAYIDFRIPWLLIRLDDGEFLMTCSYNWTINI